ncbi:hypothetical protein AAFN60_01900 [Roseibacillus persicicus]|uniref:hypothetical protein n=1 Tax=Roseibacillus persicicus TaxID=454148 RepID=UPI00398A511B
MNTLSDAEKKGGQDVRYSGNQESGRHEAEQFPLFNEQGEPADQWHLLSPQARLTVTLSVVASIRKEGETLSVGDLAELAGISPAMVRQLESMALAKACQLLASRQPSPRPQLTSYAHFLIRRAEQGKLRAANN